MQDLIRRLRKFVERWPQEFATGSLLTEAADAVERQSETIKKLLDIIDRTSMFDYDFPESDSETVEDAGRLIK